MDRLAKIRQEKQRLKKRVMQLQGQKGETAQLTQQAMKALLERKEKLQHERLQQQKYRKMQEEYLQRKAQVQRERQLQKIKNEKRMIQLQVGMKRIVMNGVQQKVKGINSDQLMARVMLSADNVGQNEGKTKWQVQKSRQQIRGQFQKYLQKQAVKKQRPKHDLYKLNEKRFELFEKKQQLLMRQILLKQVINNKNINRGNGQQQDGQQQEQNHIDVMKLTRQEMQKMLKQNNIDIEQYMHPLDQKQLLSNLPQIQSSIKQNLKLKKQQIQQQQQKQHNFRLLKAQLKDWIRNYPNKDSVNNIQQLIDQLLESIVFEYEKRHFPLTQQQRQQKISQIQKQYHNIILNNQLYQLAQNIIDRLIENLKQQMLLDVSSEIHQLHQFAHDKTAMSFDWLFQRKSYLDYVGMDKDRLAQVKLEYIQAGDDITYDKRKQNNKLMNDPKKQSQNIFDTQNSTTQLIHDIKLLTIEDQFFQSIEIQLKRQIIQSIEQDNFILKNQGSLYIITSQNIKLLSNQKDTGKIIVTFKKQIKNIKEVKKLNNTWVILNKQNLFIYSDWNIQILSLAIGERINSPSGLLATVQIFPIFTLFGSLCSVILGFEKGQVMKYNFNRNRITSIQTNLTYYHPLGPIVKTGDQPAFPLNLRNTIEYSTQKTSNQTNKPKGQLHEFRQFFDHHNQQIVGVCFYKHNMFITVDKSMHCSIWLYDHKRGTKSYQAYYNFIIKSDYTVYKQSDNPRFQDLYPSPTFPQSPQQLYNKWMEQQTYLKSQIYNNPKKATSYFKTPNWNNQASQQPVWKFNYDSKTKKILKIFSTYYNLVQGKSECKQVKLWKDNIVLLVQRQHVMRTDLKTIKIYLWNIDDKKLKSIAIQFDTFQEQKYFNFQIIPNPINGVDHPLIATISSGKILLYSMLSGQLLKDISQEPSCTKVKSYNFLSIQNGYFSNFYGSTKQSISQFFINNKNTKQKTQQFLKTVQITRKKYNNLA